MRRSAKQLHHGAEIEDVESTVQRHRAHSASLGPPGWPVRRPVAGGSGLHKGGGDPPAVGEGDRRQGQKVVAGPEDATGRERCPGACCTPGTEAPRQGRGWRTERRPRRGWRRSRAALRCCPPTPRPARTPLARPSAAGTGGRQAAGWGRRCGGGPRSCAVATVVRGRRRCGGGPRRCGGGRRRRGGGHRR